MKIDRAVKKIETIIVSDLMKCVVAGNLLDFIPEMRAYKSALECIKLIAQIENARKGKESEERDCGVIILPAIMGDDD